MEYLFCLRPNLWLVNTQNGPMFDASYFKVLVWGKGLSICHPTPCILKSRCLTVSMNTTLELTQLCFVVFSVVIIIPHGQTLLFSPGGENTEYIISPSIYLGG